MQDCQSADELYQKSKQAGHCAIGLIFVDKKNMSAPPKPMPAE
jgi:hypothetical protein